MKTKIILLILFLYCSCWLYAQEFIDNVHLEVEDTLYLPHYGQNAVLDSVLSITMPNNFMSHGLSVSSNNNNIVFHIPVKIWVYHNDNGNNAALSITEVNNLFNSVNTHFLNNNTGIKFYLKCQIEHIYSTKFNTINSDSEYEEMLSTYRDPMAHNWHLIRSTDYTNSADNWTGMAKFPWKNNNFGFAVKYGGVLDDYERRATVHEIGHTLGLLHTHENTRGSGNYNGDADDCQQESVSRSRTQPLFWCVSTAGKKKCEVNGDALCDTDAAPNTNSNKWIQLNNSIDCSYTGGGTDNWGDAWTPPTTNFMSYLSCCYACWRDFTSGQIGVMHSYILLYMGSSIYPYPGAIPWYNLNSLSVNGTVNSGINKSYTVPQTIEVANNGQYTVNSGATVSMLAGESITLYPGFQANTGSAFSAKAGEISCSSVITSSLLSPAYSTVIDSSDVTYNTSLSAADINECSAILLRALNRVNNSNHTTLNAIRQQSVNNYNKSNIPANTAEILLKSKLYYSNNTVFNSAGENLTIYNIAGISIMYSNKEKIDVSHLLAGVYVVKSDKGNILKFIK